MGVTVWPMRARPLAMPRWMLGSSSWTCSDWLGRNEPSCAKTWFDLRLFASAWQVQISSILESVTQPWPGHVTCQQCSVCGFLLADFGVKLFPFVRLKGWEALSRQSATIVISELEQNTKETK